MFDLSAVTIKLFLKSVYVHCAFKLVSLLFHFHLVFDQFSPLVSHMNIYCLCNAISTDE